MENRNSKYFKYAIGEIILVVIGILIALQINNWNVERIQKMELSGLLQNIGNVMKSDIKDLSLLVTARKNIGVKTDSILGTIANQDHNFINPRFATYVNLTFGDLNNYIYFKSNTSAFETLNNSTIYRNIQNSDLAALLSAYYTSAEKIKEVEQRHNEQLEYLNKEWASKFKNKPQDQDIFLKPWKYSDVFTKIESSYIDVLKDPQTIAIMEFASYEPFLIKQYEEQLLMGRTIVEMINNSETAFDEKTKLAFSGILYSFADADVLSVLINGKIPTGFKLKNVASGFTKNTFSNENDCLIINYPKDKYLWMSPYLEVSALGGRVNEMNFKGYTTLVLEMKGVDGGESFEIAMKDKNDPNDGSESRVNIVLTDEWKTYEIETSQFKTADMDLIKVPLSFIFRGNEGRKIKLRTVQFKKSRN